MRKDLIKKVNNQLTEIQKGKSARVINNELLEIIIKDCELVGKFISKITDARADFIYTYQAGEHKKGWNYESTGVVVEFSKNGSVTDIRSYRNTAWRVYDEFKILNYGEFSSMERRFLRNYKFGTTGFVEYDHIKEMIKR